MDGELNNNYVENTVFWKYYIFYRDANFHTRTHLKQFNVQGFYTSFGRKKVVQNIFDCG